jgi:hypothetical protein
MSDFESSNLHTPKKYGNILIFGGLIVFVLLAFQLVTSSDTSENTDSVNSSQSQTVSSCEIAMERASLEPDSTRAETFLKATAFSCGSGSEWNAALRKYPAAMGFDTVSGDELGIICYNYPDSPTCVNP